MASEFLITSPDDLIQVSSFVHDHFGESNNALKIVIKNAGRRSLSQNAFQHMIYGEISKYLISKGRTDWTPEFTKENLKNKFLGWIDKEYVDIVSGQKLVKSVLRKTSTLDKGESFHFTTAILDWSDSIGCYIKIPDDCEYRKLQEQQNQ
jgi:hypothetical protein